MTPILLASTNRGKLVEIQALMRDFDLILPQQLGLSLEVVEDGLTYAENAARKALAFCRASGLVALADDSGLEVDVLDGAPGLHSARFSPLPGASDADRRRLLVEKCTPHPRPWRARFHCTVALAEPKGGLFFFEGECRGEIIPEERGGHGFGYDPLFLLAEINKTMAELTTAEKNQLSHRARAVKAALPLLSQLV